MVHASPRYPLGVTLLLCALACPALAQPALPPPGNEPEALVATTAKFVFRSHFWLNLHDYLYGLGRGDLEPEDTARSSLGTLPSDERADWAATAAYYQQHMADRHHRRDSLMRAVRFRLADLETSEQTSADLKEVLERLARAAPAYRACWWPRHDERNREWTASLVAFLENHENTLLALLPRYFQYPWPEGTLPVDVVTYASWGGANTVAAPNHLMMSSLNAGYKEEAALEMVFHESSHLLIDSDGALLSTLSEAAETYGVELPSRLWHGLLFYTTGMATRQVLADAGHPGYTIYAVANGLSERAHRAFWPHLETHWQPFLDGQTDMKTALHRLVEALAADQTR